ncbi:PRC-barrel domain-containing protein [Jidongwangia harbinensis]|uniref:PRC-barrel domain-containing protein n=1 Tax=Jidongwangia harbinensis TaxID=2878561 RepID=UPI001CD9DAAC|nr:PRC-barrel domain-containing protein [Jidongwangia harbinensis]MCA2216371.1 PRC-barrel domain-containing protein [Jidongwangia harbinensis]MCA2217106.1 PRC-barrel domain-containing protein [Jidongwangia harbinensis]
MITRNDIQRLFGKDVYESGGGKIGSAGQVYLDNRSGDPEWVSVKTGLFGTKESFVPLQRASLTDDRIVVPFDSDTVKNAPRIDADGDLSPAEEDELYRYYGYPAAGGDLDTGTAGYGRESRTDSRHAEHHTSWPGTDDATARPVAGARTGETGRARLRRYVVTEQHG